MTKTITVTVSKASYDLGQGMRQFLAETRRALNDGWQPGQDIPTILLAVYQDLISHIKDASAIAGEPKEDQRAFVRALSESGADIAFDFLGDGSVPL